MNADNTLATSQGAYLVGLDFNPSGDATVTQIKSLAAQLLNLCNDLKNAEGAFPEKSRLASLAMTNIEQGAMWAVKSATKKHFEAPAVGGHLAGADTSDSSGTGALSEGTGNISGAS